MTGRASRRALVAIVATLGLALVILLVAAAVETLPGTGDSASTSSVPGPAPSDSDDASSGEGLGNSPGNEADGAPPTGPATPTDGEEASEVPPAPQETSPIGLPPSPPLPDLVVSPLPPTASETGGLVAGYPVGLIPPTTDATVTSSSVASDGNRLQVTLAASTSMASAAVLDFYRVAFAANDFVDTVAPAATGSTALLFSRGNDTILITVTPTESGESNYSVFGAFTAAK